MISQCAFLPASALAFMYEALEAYNKPSSVKDLKSCRCGVVHGLKPLGSSDGLILAQSMHTFILGYLLGYFSTTLDVTF
jgi:hypothetical protein